MEVDQDENLTTEQQAELLKFETVKQNENEADQIDFAQVSVENLGV